MINTTMTIEIKTLEETFDDKGTKISYGTASFNYYSKDGRVLDDIPIRAKGTPAVAIASAGVGSTGLGIGYLDLEITDTGKGYKQKNACFVIRTFIVTAANPTTSTTVVLDPQPTLLENNEPALVGATAVAVASNNGYLNTANGSVIPF